MKNLVNIYVITILLISTIVLFILFIKYLRLYNKSKQKTENLETLYDSVRSFKHDFNNIILVLGGYIYNNDIDNLKTYYNELLKECNESNNLSILSQDTINNPAIYSLINSKYQKALSLNINFNLDLFFDFNSLKFSTYQLSRILGILLDNAIEASNDSIEKYILLSIHSLPNQNIKNITISNSFENDNLDINKIFDKGISSKSNHLGIGLWKVNKIIKKYNNITLESKIENNKFYQILKIYE